MLVCLCKGVSDRQLRAEIAAGRQSLRELRRACGAGTDCGCCIEQLRELVEGCKAEQGCSR